MKDFNAFKAEVLYDLMAVLVHSKKCPILKLSPGIYEYILVYISIVGLLKVKVKYLWGAFWRSW